MKDSRTRSRPTRGRAPLSAARSRVSARVSRRLCSSCVCRSGRSSLASVPNRLAQETSPYLLQHKDNPVEWYPWGEAALARAREEDRPILLSIGYSACHWCHVMERESFEDEATA